jgi:hypothetical protein
MLHVAKMLAGAHLLTKGGDIGDAPVEALE